MESKMKQKTRLPKKNEILGLNLIRVASGNAALIYCFDGVLRECKLLKARHGDLFLLENDLVLIKKGKVNEIMHKYSPDEVQQLQKKGCLQKLGSILKEAEKEREKRFDKKYLAMSSKSRVEYPDIDRELHIDLERFDSETEFYGLMDYVRKNHPNLAKKYSKQIHFDFWKKSAVKKIDEYLLHKGDGSPALTWALLHLFIYPVKKLNKEFEKALKDKNYIVLRNLIRFSLGTGLKIEKSMLEKCSKLCKDKVNAGLLELLLSDKLLKEKIEKNDFKGFGLLAPAFACNLLSKEDAKLKNKMKSYAIKEIKAMCKKGMGMHVIPEYILLCCLDKRLIDSDTLEYLLDYLDKQEYSGIYKIWISFLLWGKDEIEEFIRHEIISGKRIAFAQPER